MTVKAWRDKWWGHSLIMAISLAIGFMVSRAMLGQWPFAPTVAATPIPIAYQTAYPAPATPTPREIGVNTGGFEAASAGAGMSIEDPAYLSPKWWNQTDAQRRLSTSMAYAQMYGAGGKLLGLDAMEKLRLYQVAWKHDLGFVLTNPYQACAGGECWTCQAYRDAVVCERSNGEIAVNEFSSGPQIAAHVTVVAPPTPGK